MAACQIIRRSSFGSVAKMGELYSIANMSSLS
jgi:hypothetical protein